MPAAADGEDVAELEQIFANLEEWLQQKMLYKPHTIELAADLKVFIPEYIPCVDEPDDVFLGVPRPDGEPHDLGLDRVWEPVPNLSRILQLDAKREGSGLTISCLSMGGDILDQMSDVDPQEPFAGLFARIQERMPAPPGTYWRMVLPNGKCPGEAQSETALMVLFGFVQACDEQEQQADGVASAGSVESLASNDMLHVLTSEWKIGRREANEYVDLLKAKGCDTKEAFLHLDEKKLESFFTREGHLIIAKKQLAIMKGGGAATQDVAGVGVEVAVNETHLCDFPYLCLSHK